MRTGCVTTGCNDVDVCYCRLALQLLKQPVSLITRRRVHDNGTQVVGLLTGRSDIAINLQVYVCSSHLQLTYGNRKIE